MENPLAFSRTFLVAQKSLKHGAELGVLNPHKCFFFAIFRKND
jgi:hypothetical protein